MYVLRATAKYLSIVFLLAIVTDGSAQNDLDIFGYFQSTFSQNRFYQKTRIPAFGQEVESVNNYNSFYLQQLNLFLRNDFGEGFSAWVNFEFVNSFSSEKQWGSANLEEAWLRYELNYQLKIKAGLLIPIFNNLNEVQNRTPYLPYIFRPFIYENSIKELLKVGDYRPEQAYMQIYGTLRPGKFNVDYAAYLGNAKDFINSDPSEIVTTGKDTSTVLLLGGRLGLHRERFKFGISATYDKSNETDIGLGEVPRFRIGGDLSFGMNRFTIESEVVFVRHDENSSEINLNQQFYYATLLYDATDKFYTYVSYNFLKNNNVFLASEGIKGYYFGLGFRPHEAVVVKGQFVKLDFLEDTLAPSPQNPFETKVNIDIHVISVALSVSF